MTLEEAIKIKTTYLHRHTPTMSAKEVLADKLSIIALKYCNERRLLPSDIVTLPLPSKTKD